MFLCEHSMTLCLVYKTKSSEQSSNMVWDAIKINYPLVPYAGKLDICAKTWTSCLNQMLQTECSFSPFVLLMTDSSLWTVSESERVSVYCIQCRQDSGDVVISFCFWHDVTLAFSIISVKPLRDWTPVGRAYVDALLGRQCLCKRLCPGDVILHLQSKWAWLNKCFICNEEDVLSYETCRMF